MLLKKSEKYETKPPGGALYIKYYTIDRTKPPQEEQFFRRRLLQLGKKEVLAGYILICPWILILTNDNFAGKEEAADFYSFQGELVACLCVLSVIIITIIVNIANVMKIAVKVIVADNKYLGFFLSFFFQVWIYFTTWKKRKSSLLSCQVSSWHHL